MKSSLSAIRLGADPIFTPHMDSRMGDNLCGPSVIEVPKWVEGALGRYYLYFADHKGSYIRLAFADEVTGPWTMYEPGALDIAASFYPTETPPAPIVETLTGKSAPSQSSSGANSSCVGPACQDCQSPSIGTSQ